MAETKSNDVRVVDQRWIFILIRLKEEVQLQLRIMAFYKDKSKVKWMDYAIIYLCNMVF
jgi:hypothetical protein